ncbi:Kinesin motor domain containing protein [Trichomonas vaginalis G3]|uniref:Kinesin-like protein n=1 Tax=Trichomonas vaginalis (strain ATCC PRA-98 / G3) TaxID=412133 RepID=A2DS59_TRIV3|nr:kinesin 4 family [Trichomonas vaginalis G3]EAY16829.1 Kinesin motor domain containing protein [Trichomonas vaginalis G3]KAI5490760.1 kinesin 4 family [Trichomonas vaginalis G3]|eukprot:XP_001329052.1 Kinesin motor domain containing protein [Trichomonas vaginalis G3]
MQDSDTGQPETQNRSSGTSVTVVVRVRPANDREKSVQQGSLIKTIDDRFLVFDPPGERAQKQTFISSRGNRAKNISFGFDKIFDETSTQSEVFDFVKNIIFQENGGLLDGFNCTVLAYGASGSGKTFSMAGTQENPGLMSRSVEHIFQSIKLRTGRAAKIRMSYLEIYNENIRDLLNPTDSKNKELKIVDDPEHGITVTGLSHCYPTNTDEVLRLVQIGNTNRTQAPTEANPFSSRSHAILQIIVENCDDVPGMSTTSQIGKLSLIDLAGSERATSNTGVRLRETAKINCSLLALGNCITALCNGSSHIPFRQSKLTRLLMDSLGGNCKTICLSCISPSYATYEDTFNTLQYANKAKNIKTNVKKNTVNVKAHVAEYQAMIEKLRTQVQELQQTAVNIPLITAYGRACDTILQSQRTKIQSMLTASLPSQEQDLQTRFESLSTIKPTDFTRRVMQRVNAYLQESHKNRPQVQEQKKWLDQEQQIRALKLEKLALSAVNELYQAQVAVQREVIQNLSLRKQNDGDEVKKLVHMAELVDVTEELDQPSPFVINEMDAKPIAVIKPPGRFQRNSICSWSRIKKNPVKQAPQEQLQLEEAPKSARPSLAFHDYFKQRTQQQQRTRQPLSRISNVSRDFNQKYSTLQSTAPKTTRAVSNEERWK